jgi:hypothetical protein
MVITSHIISFQNNTVALWGIHVLTDSTAYMGWYTVLLTEVLYAHASSVVSSNTCKQNHIETMDINNYPFVPTNDLDFPQP